MLAVTRDYTTIESAQSDESQELVMQQVPEVNTLDVVMKDAGRQIADRRTKLGMSQRQLALRAGIDRETLKKLEASSPGTRETTVGAVLRTLDALEHELGADGPDAAGEEMVEFRYGEAVVRGPVRNAAELEESLVRLVQRLGLGGGGRP